MSKPEQPWIDWTGGDCPVPAGTAGSVLYQDGDIDWSSDLSEYRWAHLDNYCDIIGYRLDTPAPKPSRVRVIRRYEIVRDNGDVVLLCPYVGGVRVDGLTTTTTIDLTTTEATDLRDALDLILEHGNG